MYHIPVMLNEVLEGLKIFDGGVWLDGTLGGGGHARGILAGSAKNGKLVAIDRDIEAIQHNRALVDEFPNRLTLVHGAHENAGNILDKLGITEIDGALLDLGLSSRQIDSKERGFSYSQDAPLDMRMDTSQSLDAKKVVNTYPEERLAEIIFRYGEEEASRKIAKAIAAHRINSEIKTTQQLADIIKSCIPYFKRGGHPAKKTFQAIRIEVNGELTGLADTLKTLILRLKPGGRLLVITFHSLEDRITKQVFKELSSGCICDKSIPVCICNHKPDIKLIGNKPVCASEQELIVNPRAASAKLRIAEKL